jgi:hypothetical protein
MSEAALWRNLKRKMFPRYWAEVTRHEDAVSSGIADVSFVNRGWLDFESTGRHGWMELKYRAKAPLRSNSICSLPHFTDAQRVWLAKKGRSGGMTFLLLQLDRDYLLFTWQEAEDVGRVTTERLYEIAKFVSEGRLDADGLWKAIHG